MSDQEKMIEVVGLEKVFEDKKRGLIRAVDHIDLDVRGGEVFGLLGTNGAGKTTTLRMLDDAYAHFRDSDCCHDVAEQFNIHVSKLDVRIRHIKEKIGGISNAEHTPEQYRVLIEEIWSELCLIRTTK